MTDYSQLIEAMQEFNSPQNQKSRLVNEWKGVTSISALYFDLDEPQCDGDIEIIFVPSDKATLERDKFLKRTSSTKVNIVTLEEGIKLVQQSNCSGGGCELDRLKTILEIVKPHIH